MGDLDATLGELKGMMTDDVSPPLVLNVGRPICCAVGGSIARLIKNCANCINNFTPGILGSMGWSTLAHSYYITVHATNTMWLLAFVTFPTTLHTTQSVTNYILLLLYDSLMSLITACKIAHQQ